MSLAPLPKTQRLGDMPGHIDEALREYGQACRAAALEEAAQICDGEKWFDSGKKSVDYIKAFNEGCADCEAAIRRLK